MIHVYKLTTGWEFEILLPSAATLVLQAQFSPVVCALSLHDSLHTNKQQESNCKYPSQPPGYGFIVPVVVNADSPGHNYQQP